MSSPENHIADYLDGLLSGTDLVAFEQALAQDAKLREAVALQRRIESELGALQDREEIAELIGKAEAKHPYRAPRASVHRLGPWLAIAAVAVLTLGTWFLLQPGTPDAAVLATRYGELNSPAAILPSRYGQIRANPVAGNPLNDATTPIDSAQVYVYLEQYPEALAAYEAIAPSEMTDSLSFEMALVLLQMNRPEPALERLQGLSTDFGGGLYWYRAIASLQQGNIQAARTQVQQLLEDTESPYRLDAVKLLEELD
jgi:tetratricopeptide (TPR) repeat protein